MRKILTLVVAVSLFASPALAFASPAVGPDDPGKPAKVDLVAAAKAAGKEIVAEETEALGTSAPQNAVAKDKLWVGVALVAVGAGLIYKGVDLHESDPDPFGRTKNADSYLAMGVGSVLAFFGAMGIRGGLAGRGFND